MPSSMLCIQHNFPQIKKCDQNIVKFTETVGQGECKRMYLCLRPPFILLESIIVSHHKSKLKLGEIERIFK